MQGQLCKYKNHFEYLDTMMDDVKLDLDSKIVCSNRIMKIVQGQFKMRILAQ